MKSRSYCMAAVVGLLGTTPLLVLAQPADNPNRDRREPVTRQTTDGWGDRSASNEADRRLGQPVRFSELEGIQVRNNQNERLGTIDNLVLDLSNGRVAEVIVSAGGVAGIGARNYSVPPTMFKHGPAGEKVMMLDVDTAKLRGAPEFDVSGWQAEGQSNRTAEVYRYFGQAHYQQGSAGAAASGTAGATVGGGIGGAADIDRNRQPGATGRPASTPGSLVLADKLVGMRVDNPQDQNIGKVDELIVDLPAGRVVQVVVSTGGFLGVGDELNAVPPSALSHDAGKDIVYLDRTKEQLTAAPRFKRSEWPDFGDAAYGSQVYRSYGVEPYFSSEADNTRRNVRDRQDATTTPLDQGNSQADIDMTTRIRQEITAREGLSVNAKNVKVITRDGHVTLRGPVNSAEEKRIIEEIAKRHATADRFDNQLEVTVRTPERQ